MGYEWNHPSMKGVEPMNCSAPVYAILDPTKTLDEQLAIQAAITEQLAAELLQPDPEIMAQIETDELIVPGLPGEPDVRTGPAGITGRLCVIGSQLKEDAIAALFTA